MNAADLTLPELASRLRAWADGYLPSVAAVELLITHGVWLRRPELLNHIRLSDPAEPGPAMADIDWEQVCNLRPPASGSELGVLDVACSLGYGCEVDLRGVLLSCDRSNVQLIADAVLTTGGAR